MVVLTRKPFREGRYKSSRKIKYLPQRYIENICNDLGNSFQDEINKMVFSYLPEHEKLDKNSFDDLVNYLCRDIDSKILSFKMI